MQSGYEEVYSRGIKKYTVEVSGIKVYKQEIPSEET